MADPKQEQTNKQLREALVARMRKRRWKYLFKALHLHDEDKAERFTTLIAMHNMLDRALTALLTLRLCPRPASEEESIKLTNLVNKIGFHSRIEMARTAGLIPDSCARNLIVVNDVRNDLAHWRPKNPEDGWGLGNVKQIASEKEFVGCMTAGDRAFKELLLSLSKVVGR